MLWNKWCKDYYRHFDPFDLFVFQVELPKQRRHSFVICVRYPLWRNKYRLKLLRPPNQYSSPSLKISSQEWVSTSVSPVVACLRWVGSTLCFDGTMVYHFHSFHSVPILPFLSSSSYQPSLFLSLLRWFSQFFISLNIQSSQKTAQLHFAVWLLQCQSAAM